MAFPPFLEAHVDQAKVVAMVRMLTLIIQWESSKRLWIPKEFGTTANGHR